MVTDNRLALSGAGPAPSADRAVNIGGVDWLVPASFGVDPDLERLLDEEEEIARSGERRVVDPDTGGEKGTKTARPELLPTAALLAVAEHFGKGASKYADRNWERGYAWSLSYGALLRHLWAWWGGEDRDAELDSHHLDAVLFHALVLRTFVDEHPEKDDRP